MSSIGRDLNLTSSRESGMNAEHRLPIGVGLLIGFLVSTLLWFVFVVGVGTILA